MPDGSSGGHANLNPNQPNPIRLKFPATDIAVRSALKKITIQLEHLKLDPGTFDMIELVLAEATNNIVEHAYADKAGEIQLSCSVKAPLLEFILVDHGTPMPEQQLPQPKVHDLDCDLDALPEGGFGWALLHDLCSSISYRRLPQTNELRLLLPFELP